MPSSTPAHALTPPYSHCVGILLGAGHGRRYAAVAPGHDKLMEVLDDGTPVALASARALRQATARTIAVLRRDQDALRALLIAAGCEVVTVAANADGMGDSLATAARHLIEHSDAAESSCLVALADMPWLRAATCAQVAALTPAHGIVAPRWQGKRGHPVAFARERWPELAALSGDVGARALLARHPVHDVDVDDPGVLADVDTPGDLHPGD